MIAAVIVTVIVIPIFNTNSLLVRLRAGILLFLSTINIILLKH